MRELWILRHGQTDLNASGVYFGSTDVPLNETGRAQARAVRSKMPEDGFDLCHTSPLLRASQTGALAVPDVAMTPAPELAERALGEWEGLSVEQIRALDPAGWESWTTQWQTYTPPGGESFLDVWHRVSTFLATHLARSDWERALLVSHAGPIRILLAAGLSLPKDAVWRFAPENAGLATLCFNKEGYGWLRSLNH